MSYISASTLLSSVPVSCHCQVTPGFGIQICPEADGMPPVPPFPGARVPAPLDALVPPTPRMRPALPEPAASPLVSTPGEPAGAREVPTPPDPAAPPSVLDPATF